MGVALLRADGHDWGFEIFLVSRGSATCVLNTTDDIYEFVGQVLVLRVLHIRLCCLLDSTKRKVFDWDSDHYVVRVDEDDCIEGVAAPRSVDVQDGIDVDLSSKAAIAL